MNDQRRVIQDALNESQEDYVGLWSLVWNVRHEFADANVQEIKELVLSTLQLLLSAYGLLIGDFKQDKFFPWDCTPSEAITRVDTEWRKLGRDPDIGEIAWLVSPNSQKESFAKTL
jgi:hypothetical protein